MGFGTTAVIADQPCNQDCRKSNHRTYGKINPTRENYKSHPHGKYGNDSNLVYDVYKIVTFKEVGPAIRSRLDNLNITQPRKLRAHIFKDRPGGCKVIANNEIQLNAFLLQSF